MHNEQDIYPDAAALEAAAMEEESATAEQRPALAPHSILLADYNQPHPF